MSGGSYDYLYCMVEGMADRIVQSGGTPERQRFAKHLRRVARAMHALIWSSGHTRHRVVAWQPLPERWTP